MRTFLRTGIRIAAMTRLIPAFGMATIVREADSLEGLEITHIGTAPRGRAGKEAARAAGIRAMPSLAHTVVSVTLHPGAALPETFAYPSAMITVISGRVRVEALDGPARLYQGPGRPMKLEGTKGVKSSVLEGQGDLEDGRVAVLGKGNGVGLEDQACGMRAYGGRNAVVQVSVLLDLDEPDPLCWICPHVTT